MTQVNFLVVPNGHFHVLTAESSPEMKGIGNFNYWHELVYGEIWR